MGVASTSGMHGTLPSSAPCGERERIHRFLGPSTQGPQYSGTSGEGAHETGLSRCGDLLPRSHLGDG